MRLRPILGNERLFDNDILAARALESGDMPVVVDSILIGQKQERTEIADLLSIDLPRSAKRAQHHAATMIAARRKGPSSRELVTAGHFFRFSSRIVRRRVHRGRILVPHLALRLVAEERELPRMHPDHARNPACRRRYARDVENRVNELQKRNLATAKTGRL